MYAVFLFLFRKTDWRLNAILSAILVLSTASGVNGVILSREFTSGLHALAYLAAAAGVLIGPAVLLYLRVYLTGRFLSVKDDLFHIILFPAVLFCLTALAVMQNDRYTYRNLDTISALILLLYGALYFWFALSFIARTRKKSGIKKRPVFWPLFLFADFLMLLLARVAVFLSRGGFDPSRADAYLYLILCAAGLSAAEVLALLVLGGIKAYQSRSPAASQRLAPEEAKRVAKLVRERVELKKGFRDPQLSLKGMARSLNISPRELARIMEDRFAAHFMDYVNGWRVREAIALLERFAGRRTILGLSLQSGFDSKAVFSKAFKKLTGFTPREYVKNFKRQR
jgi:AraC-like DNA-binding protein